MRIGWKRINWGFTAWVVSIHLLAAGGTAAYAALHGFTWAALGIAAGMYLACGFGITAGYHRLFSHGTYEAHPLVRAFHLLFGAAAFQNSALKWSSEHRRHHAFVDGPYDPYSMSRGFWWAHMGWIFFKDPQNAPGGNVADLERDPLVRIQHRFYFPIATVAGLALPLALGFVFGDPWGGLVIGGFLRIAILYQATFCVNSVAHYFGCQPYSDRNTSRDSAVTALISLGEGYHNYHHAFPFDYRNGIRVWHYDPSKWLIRLMSWIGLAKNLVRAPGESILKARLRMQARRAEMRFADRPQVAELIRRARERVERLLDRWAALKAQCADLRSRLDRSSREAAASLRREVAEVRRRFREEYETWRRALRRPEILSAAS